MFIFVDWLLLWELISQYAPKTKRLTKNTQRCPFKITAREDNTLISLLKITTRTAPKHLLILTKLSTVDRATWYWTPDLFSLYLRNLYSLQWSSCGWHATVHDSCNGASWVVMMPSRKHHPGCLCFMLFSIQILMLPLDTYWMWLKMEDLYCICICITAYKSKERLCDPNVLSEAGDYWRACDLANPGL